MVRDAKTNLTEMLILRTKITKKKKKKNYRDKITVDPSVGECQELLMRAFIWKYVGGLTKQALTIIITLKA